MRSIAIWFGVSAMLAGVAGCGGAVGDPAHATAAASPLDSAQAGGDRGMEDCPGRVDFDGVSERVEAQLDIARLAVCRYRRIEAALADGYADSGLPCIPGQGYHYIRSSLVGTTDIRRPPVLMYTADGDLNSPEWIAPESQFPTPPTIFGQTMHSEDELGLWILHVWVWKLNPNGVFSDVNPDVTCP